MEDPHLSGEAPLFADQEADVGAADVGNASVEGAEASPVHEGHGEPTIRSRGRRPRGRGSLFLKLAAVALPSALALAFLLHSGFSLYLKKIPTVKDLTAVHPLPPREEPGWKAPLVSSSEDDAYFTCALMKLAVGRVVERLEAERPATPSLLAAEVMVVLARTLSDGQSDNIVGQRFELTEMSDLGSGSITPGLRPFEVVGYSSEDYDSVELEVKDLTTEQRYAMVVRLLPSVETMPLTLHAPPEAYPLAEMMHCTQGALQVIGSTPLNRVGTEKGIILPYVLGQIAHLPRIIQGVDFALLNVVEFKELVRCDLQSVVDFAQGLPTGWKAHLARGVLKTVLQLQHAGLSHNKLNANSFFVRRDGSVALTSFDASTPFGQALTPEILFAGLWTEPSLLAELEGVIKGAEPPRADPRSDMWSLGALLYEIMMDGELPYGLSDLGDCKSPLLYVTQIPTHAVPESLHDDMNGKSINRRWQSLIRRLLEPDREKRITSEDIVVEFQDLLTDVVETEVLTSDDFLEFFEKQVEPAEVLVDASLIASRPGSEPVPEEFADTAGTEEPSHGEEAPPALPGSVDVPPSPSELRDHALDRAQRGRVVDSVPTGERNLIDPTRAKTTPAHRLSRFEVFVDHHPSREPQTRRESAVPSLVQPGRSQQRTEHAVEALPALRQVTSSSGTPGLAGGEDGAGGDPRDSEASGQRPGSDRVQAEGRFAIGSYPIGYTTGTGAQEPAATEAPAMREQPSAAPESSWDVTRVASAAGPAFLQPGVAASGDKGTASAGSFIGSKARGSEEQQSSPQSQTRLTQSGPPRRTPTPVTSRFLYAVLPAARSPGDPAGVSEGAGSSPQLEPFKPSAPRSSPYYQLLTSRIRGPPSAGPPSFSAEPSQTEPSGEGSQVAASSLGVPQQTGLASASASERQSAGPYVGPLPQRGKALQPGVSQPPQAGSERSPAASTGSKGFGDRGSSGVERTGAELVISTPKPVGMGEQAAFASRA
ncbi:hypothetical protein Esti_003346 [Eimeria stiedai]